MQLIFNAPMLAHCIGKLGFMMFTSAAANRFSVYGDYTALWAMLSQPVIQAFCQCRRIQPLKYTPKSIAVRNTMWQFQKLLQPRLPRFSEILHIREVVPVTDQAAQSNDYNVFQLVADIAFARPPRILQSLELFPQFFYLHTVPLYRFLNAVALFPCFLALTYCDLCDIIKLT